MKPGLREYVSIDIPLGDWIKREHKGNIPYFEEKYNFEFHDDEDCRFFCYRKRS